MHFYWILLKSDVFGDCQPCVLAGTSENYGSAWYPLDGHYWITSAWLYSLLKYLPSFWMLLVACNSYVMHLSVLHMEAATQNTNRLTMCENGCSVALHSMLLYMQQFTSHHYFTTMNGHIRKFQLWSWKWLLSCPTQYVTVYATAHQSPLLYNYERTYQKVPVMTVKAHNIEPTPTPTKGVDTGSPRNVLRWEKTEQSHKKYTYPFIIRNVAWERHN
jgi:hypothetical protein